MNTTEPERRISLGVLKRKRVPASTLVAVKDSVIDALGLPTKKGRYVEYIIAKDGTATKGEDMSEFEFTVRHEEVFRTTKTSTLDGDHSISPSRLSMNIQAVKKRKAGKITPAEDDETTPTAKRVRPEPPESTTVESMDVQKSDPPPGSGVVEVTEETKEEQVNEKVNEEVVELSGEVSNPPKEKSRVIPAEDRVNMVYRLIDTEMNKESPDQERIDSLLLTAIGMEKRMGGKASTDKAPSNVKKVEEKDKLVEEERKEAQKENTMKVHEALAEQKGSAQNRLSKNQAADTMVVDAETGGSVDAHMSQKVGHDNEKAVSNGVMDKKHRKDIGEPMDIDQNNSTGNMNSNMLLSTDHVADELISPVTSSSTTASSANKMAAAEMAEPMEMEKTKTTEEIEKGQRQKFRETQTEIKESAEGMERKAKARKMGVTDPRISMEAGMKERAKARSVLLDLYESGGDIVGFESMMESLRAEGMLENTEDVKIRKRVLDILRKDNKMVDILVKPAPSEQEIFEQAVTSKVSRLGIEGIRGTSGVGTPVFRPAQSLSDLMSFQHQIMTMTDVESREIRDELTPHWNEFKLGRLNAGVLEMERLPTRLLTSDHSTIKEAHKLREDVSQQEQTFGLFMYWLLHDKMDSSRPWTWRTMFLYSAALGYNDLTQAQINWIITGNPDGSLDANTRFDPLEEAEGDPLETGLEVRGAKLTRKSISDLHSQVVGNPEPTADYPSRNTSPSAAPVDNSIHPDGTSGMERAAAISLSGVPSKVSNIPDPRYSKRGGVEVPNVRVITVLNPKYDEKKQKGLSPKDEGYEPKFITEQVPDIGAGSKDIGAEIEKAESDRLIMSLPTKLYAPIHAQACDRYLGALNYQRLSLPLDRYLSSYAQHGFGPDDISQMYNWNAYVMALYGGMLYAFVTDAAMQRTTPVFTLETPSSVGDEYMELNELLNELAKFQQNADDRAQRVDDSGAGSRPLEEHLNNFFQQQTELDKQRYINGDTAIISIDGFPSGGDTPSPTPSPTPGPTPGPTPSPTPDPTPVPPPNPWGPGPDPRVRKDEPWDLEKNDRRIDPLKPFDRCNDRLMPVPKDCPQFSSSLEMDHGIRRSDRTNQPMVRGTAPVNTDLERRSRMYSMFKR